MIEGRAGVDLRLVLPAVAGWIAAIVLVGVPDAAGSVAGAGWSLAAVLLFVAALRRRARGTVTGIAAVAVAGAVVGLVAASIAIADTRRSAPLETAP